VCNHATQFIGSIVAWARTETRTRFDGLDGCSAADAEAGLANGVPPRGLRAIASEKRFESRSLLADSSIALERTPALKRRHVPVATRPRLRHLDDVGDAFHVLRAGAIEGNELGAKRSGHAMTAVSNPAA